MDENDLDLSAPPRIRLGVAALVALLHVAVLFALIRAFAPDFAGKAVETVVSTFTVTITAPPPPPPPGPAPVPAAAGGAGEAGKKAVPREVRADTSGAGEQGSGTGAAGAGSGTGAGSGGSGPGGGLASKPVHVSGRIDNARDFPVPPGGREARIGKAVILALTIDPEGRAVSCRIYRSSGLPDTDAATCRLAMERLRFRPAKNAAGEPVSAIFYWQQKFFF
jgi:protein TonB